MDYEGHFLTKWRHGDWGPDITPEKSDHRIAMVSHDGTTYAYSIPYDNAQDFLGWVASVWGHRQAAEPLLMQNWRSDESRRSYRQRVESYLDRIGVSAWIEEE
jgi:hypothetical protein